MSSANTTHLECSNPEVVKAFAVAIRSIDITGCKSWKEGDIEITTTTINYIPLSKVMQISKQFPDEIITCEYCYESNPCEIYKEEYLNGEEKSYDLKPRYFSNIIHLDNENDCKGILDKAESFCRKLDTTEKDKDGNLFINWLPDEVWFKFEYGGADEKKYRVEATKHFNEIDFKVFEGLVRYDWQEVVPF